MSPADKIVGRKILSVSTDGGKVVAVLLDNGCELRADYDRSAGILLYPWIDVNDLTEGATGED